MATLKGDIKRHNRLKGSKWLLFFYRWLLFILSATLIYLFLGAKSISPYRHTNQEPEGDFFTLIKFIWVYKEIVFVIIVLSGLLFSLYKMIKTGSSYNVKSLSYKKGDQVLTIKTFDNKLFQIDFQHLKVTSQLTKSENYSYVSYTIYDNKKDNDIKLSFDTDQAYWRSKSRNIVNFFKPIKHNIHYQVLKPKIEKGADWEKAQSYI
ncbi:MAG: hypothetical protein CMD35_01545 [Flavobacteriales bacterium]|nr:hypothetical protein [Flavobacteriales bacterium]